MFTRFYSAVVRIPSVRLAMAAVLILCEVTGTQTWATDVPVAMSTPETITSGIPVGSTSVEIPFSISGVDGLRLDVIVPVDGAQLSLVDPSGGEVFPAGSSQVEFAPGSDRTPPLPGGVFTTTEVASPVDGVWKVRISYLPAPTQTFVLGTVFTRSRYQLGIAIARSRFLVGEDASIGLLVTDNGVPITGLNPTIAVNSMGPLPASDNGVDSDGMANDGVYSVGHVFNTPGTFTIVGTVAIPTANGPVLRRAEATVDVVIPGITLTNLSTAPVFEAAGCISGVNASLSYDVSKAGKYVTHGQLRAQNGNAIDVRNSQSLATGPSTRTISFTADDLKQLKSDGPYILALDVLEVSDTQGFILMYKNSNAGSISTTLGALCSAPIELEANLSVAQLLKNGLISALNFSFPVKVQTAGTYQISFKVVAADGTDIDLLSFSKSLSMGANTVVATLPSSRFLTVDGPYRAISLLIVRGSTTARLSTIGQTESLQRWQFFPSISGDLNNDGAVNSVDQSLLLQFRGQKALVPGDRRDLNKDGALDIRDARELQKLSCAVGTCPINQ